MKPTPIVEDVPPICVDDVDKLGISGVQMDLRLGVLKVRLGRVQPCSQSNDSSGHKVTRSRQTARTSRAD